MASIGLARLGDGLDGAWIVERREIARILAEIRRSDHPAHDLGAARLRKVGHEEHALGLQRLAHLVRDKIRELRANLLPWRGVGAQDDETDDRLALDLVWHADGG